MSTTNPPDPVDPDDPIDPVDPPITDPDGDDGAQTPAIIDPADGPDVSIDDPLSPTLVPPEDVVLDPLNSQNEPF